MSVAYALEGCVKPQAMAKKKAVKKKNKQDATLINVGAQKKREQSLKQRIVKLEKAQSKMSKELGKAMYDIFCLQGKKK